MSHRAYVYIKKTILQIYSKIVCMEMTPNDLNNEGKTRLVTATESVSII